ncbi:MAG: hypothetical protein EA365_09795 [Gloeocapsa sp. DLM2.Bin57]|nr:MAG: hypothetical protein EA365_09795 [Gloeocapsa sp. DLM2.Bin57]
MLITISRYAQTKLESLDFKTKSKFLGIISRYMNRDLASNQVRKLHGENNFIRIRYNLGDRIIACLLRNPELELRILDFVSHTTMDQGRYYRNSEGVYTILDLEQTEPIEANNLEKLDLSGLWEDSENSENLESLLENSIENYFYLYSLIHETKINPYLSLAQEQYNLVNTNLPIFLAGSAGSGKTTIALYHAIAKSIETQIDSTAQKVVYITYNSFLKEYTKEIIQQIFDFEELPNLELLDYHNLEDRLGLDREKFNPQKRINQQRFIAEFCKPHFPILNGIDPIYLWEEIRYHIKGSLSASETENGLITWEEYQQLNHHYPHHQRQLYNLASQYQDWLKNQEYWDEIDSTHNLIRRLNKGEYLYDFLYCDEVQDLTAIQIHLLLKLLRPPVEGEFHSFAQFLFTGDTAQIINPSGFSWRKVKDILHHNYGQTHTWKDFHKQFDQPRQLSYNFRSTEAIVNFSNQLLTDFPNQKAFKKGGKKPLIIRNISDKELLEGKNIFGPNSVIITVNEEDKQQLKAQFDTQRILTITEVKGLEYNEVLVWNFFSRFDGWQQNPRELTAFKNNCLYVCATRAREKLYFYEATELSFWQRAELQDYLTFSENKLDLEEFFNPNITREDWRKSAEDLARQGAYLQAKENYQRGEWYKEAEEMEAKYQYSQGYKQQAADIYLKNQDITEAISILEEINNYTQIAQIWTAENELLKAAITWEKVPNYQEALVIYESLARWSDMERCARELLEWSKVAIACEHQGKWREAAVAYQESNQIAKAANCYEQALAWDKAEICWQQLQEWSKVAIACEHQGKWREAARAYQESNQTLKAAITWEKVPNYQEALVIYENLERWSDVERCARELQEWSKVAIACEHQGKWREAARAYQESNQTVKAAQVCEKGEHWLEAIQYWQRVPDTYKVALMYQRLAGQTWENLGYSAKAALAYDQGESWTKALELYKASRQWYQLAKLYEKQAEWKEAAKIWERLGEAELFERAKCLDNAKKCWTNLEEWAKVASICEEQRLYFDAGRAWEQLGEWSKAARNYERVAAWNDAEFCRRQIQE